MTIDHIGELNDMHLEAYRNHYFHLIKFPSNNILSNWSNQRGGHSFLVVVLARQVTGGATAVCSLAEERERMRTSLLSQLSGELEERR